jgi:hypothetical protein
LGRLIDVLVLEDSQAAALRRQLVARACTLAEALSVADDAPQVQFARVASAMAEGFARTLNLSFRAAPPAPAELRRAAQLIREQFANPEWTRHR